MYLDLLPAPRRQLEQRAVASVDVSGPARPSACWQRPPHLVEQGGGAADVVDDLSRRAAGTGFNSRGTPGISALILVDHLPNHGGLTPTDMAVSVTGDMSEHMGSGPSRKTAGNPHVVLGESLYRPQEPIVRVVHTGKVGLRDEHHSNLLSRAARGRPRQDWILPGSSRHRRGPGRRAGPRCRHRGGGSPGRPRWWRPIHQLAGPGVCLRPEGHSESRGDGGGGGRGRRR
jgi:hypothetical protein